MEINKLEGVIEAILFAVGDSVELGKIAAAIEHDENTTRKIIHRMMDKYALEERGVRIMELENSFQMCTKKEMYEYALVCEVGRLDAPGRPLLFGTTEEFLRRFGIQSVDELPIMNPEQVESLKTEAEEEVQLKLDI